MSDKSTSRLLTVHILLKVLHQKHTLKEVINQELSNAQVKDHSFIKHLCFEVCRWYIPLKQRLKLFLKKPLKEKDADLELALMLGFYQLSDTRVKPYAAIHETVSLATALEKPWAKGFLNGVLRAYQRSHPSPLAEQYRMKPEQSHPSWLAKHIQSAWPHDAKKIFAANMEHSPMTLRVNEQHISTANYLIQLNQAGIQAKTCSFARAGIVLEQPLDVKELPGFEQGWVSVQDESAQLVVELIPEQNTLRILDACAAPGGKTAHILERYPNAQITALDIDAKRLSLLTENLSRLQLPCVQCQVSDAVSFAKQHGAEFDCVLIDAPCSATGIIRRHPDIKLKRKPSDIDQAVQQQWDLLTALWLVVKPGGRLIYTTCSILPEENELLIERFIQQYHSDIDQPLENSMPSWGITLKNGQQILPSFERDGFYYATLDKRYHS